MALPQIKINQTGQDDGVAGSSRFIVIGSELQVTDTANASGTWEWIFVGPADSTAVPTGLTTNDVRVTPDVEGTYLFFVIFNGAERSYVINAVGEWDSSQGGASVILPDGRRIPGEGETDQFGGWQASQEQAAKKIIRLRQEGVTVAGGPFTELDFKAIGGGQVNVLNTVSGTATVTISGGGGGAATALATTGADVIVNTAAPPTIGQALVATSPTEAAWGDVAASSGALTSARGDYISVSMSADQVNVATNNKVNFDTVQSSRGLSLTGNQVVLAAGRTYHLASQLRLDATSPSGSFMDWAWYDITGAAQLGVAANGQSLNSTGNESFGPIATHIFTPAVDTTVEVRITFAGSGADVSSFASWATIVEIGAVQANVTGGLEYMDTIEVTSDTTSVTFGEGGNGIHGRALDGDVDEVYIIESFFPDPVASVNFELRPNGITTNQFSARNYGGSSEGGDIQTGLYLVYQTASAWTIGSRAEFHAKTGKARMLLGNYFQEHSSGSFRHAILMDGSWRDTTTVVTNLDIVASVASAIRVGARFVLWRRTSTNLRADSADTYTIAGSHVVEQGTVIESSAVSLGRAAYGGSLVGVSASLEEPITAGTVTVRVKINAVTKLTAILNTSNTDFARALSTIGAIPVASGDKVTFTVEASGYTNAAALDSGLVVNVTLQNGALLIAEAGAEPVSGGTPGSDSNLWAHPATAHADDDEFNSSTLDPAWTITPAASVTAIDPYAVFASGGPRIALHTDRRASWFMWQPQNDSTATYIHKPYTFPTNVFVWSRLVFNNRYNESASNDASLALVLSTTTAGAPTISNGVVWYLNESDGSSMTLQSTFNGGTGGVTLTSTYNTGQGLTYEYLGIQKIGTTYHLWAGTADGAWTYCGSGTHSGAFDRVALYSLNTSSSAPGNMIMGCDFIRFVESATFLP